MTKQLQRVIKCLSNKWDKDWNDTRTDNWQVQLKSGHRLLRVTFKLRREEGCRRTSM